MTRADVAARLVDPAALSRVQGTGDFPGIEGALRPAAVLVPIVWHVGGAGVLLTLRAATMSSHPGQVAFPGGRVEPGETEEAAALREAAEEVGLDPRLPSVIGCLPEHLTGTGYRVTPVVAFLDPPLSLTPAPAEVQAVFELPLSVVLDPDAPSRRSREWRGQQREYWVFPHADHLIWGATAAILMNLSRVLR